MNRQYTPAQVFHDAFVTALEGGIGYWSSCHEYRWSLKDGDGYSTAVEDLDGFHAVIENIEDPETDDFGAPVLMRIDAALIERGYRLGSTTHADTLHWSNPLIPIELIDEDTFDDIDMDAGDADMIVQLGLFSEVRYG